MSTVQQIAEYAGSLFDVVGASHQPNGDNLLIVGLESTEECNLDEFGHVRGVFQMYGFKKHAGPKLESLLNFIRSKGFAAELMGRYGYPLMGRHGYPPEGDVNLKVAAIHAGLGKRGKSTVVLHPQYGPRLRFMAIKTDAPLQSLMRSALPDEENPVCKGCSICIDVCPTKALEPYQMPDTSLCLSNVSPQDEDGRSILCDKCLHLCPAAKT